MPNSRLGLWKSIKRRGKDVVSTGSAASTEESVSCGTFGSASKQSLLPVNPSSSNTEQEEVSREIIHDDDKSDEKHSGPVEEIIIQARPESQPAPSAKPENMQYTITEDGRWRLKSSMPNDDEGDNRYKGPVDVDAYIEYDDDSSSTSTTSQEREEIRAIKRRLQSRHASKIPRQIVLYDNDDNESSLAGYDDGFGTLFDEIYHNSYPFDEAANVPCIGYRASRGQTHTQSYNVQMHTPSGVARKGDTTMKFPFDEYHTVSRRLMAPDAFEC